MKKIADFWKGLTLQHVDYATRHYSRAYDIGGGAAGGLIIATPFVVVFLIGFIAGRVSG
jgi:hypothetical protein